MSQQPLSPVVTRPDGMPAWHESVRMHVPCRGCRYDLHALAVAGCCPECGLAILETLKPRFDLIWLRSVRTGMWWMLGSMYVFGWLAATSYMQAVECAMAAVMQLAGAAWLLAPGSDRSIKGPAAAWPAPLLGASLLAFLSALVEWLEWFGLPTTYRWLFIIGVLLWSAGLAILWFHLEVLARQCIAPRVAGVVRAIAWLTLLVGATMPLTIIVWEVIPGTSAVEIMYLAWLVLLTVWFFASLVTLHLMLVPLNRLIRTSANANIDQDAA